MTESEITTFVKKTKVTKDVIPNEDAKKKIFEFTKQFGALKGIDSKTYHGRTYNSRSNYLLSIEESTLRSEGYIIDLTFKYYESQMCRFRSFTNSERDIMNLIGVNESNIHVSMYVISELKFSVTIKDKIFKFHYDKGDFIKILDKKEIPYKKLLGNIYSLRIEFFEQFLDILNKEIDIYLFSGFKPYLDRLYHEVEEINQGQELIDCAIQEFREKTGIQDIIKDGYHSGIVRSRKTLAPLFDHNLRALRISSADHWSHSDNVNSGLEYYPSLDLIVINIKFNNQQHNPFEYFAKRYYFNVKEKRFMKAYEEIPKKFKEQNQKRLQKIKINSQLLNFCYICGNILHHYGNMIYSSQMDTELVVLKPCCSCRKKLDNGESLEIRKEVKRMLGISDENEQTNDQT